MKDSPGLTDSLKRWRTTLIAVAVFVALAAYVLLVEMKRDLPADQAATPTPLPLLALSIDNVQSLRITSGAPAQTGLSVLQILNMRPELAWRFSAPSADASAQEPCLSSPEGCLADPYVIHTSVDDLCHLAAQRILLEKVSDREQYGLAPVALTIEIATLSGEGKEIYIGKQTPDGMSYYVQQAGDPRLYLVAQYTLQPFFEWLKEPPFEPSPVPE